MNVEKELYEMEERIDLWFKVEELSEELKEVKI